VSVGQHQPIFPPMSSYVEPTVQQPEVTPFAIPILGVPGAVWDGVCDLQAYVDSL